MTQEALAQGLALQATLGGHAASVAMRVRLDNDGAFGEVGTRSKADCLNGLYGAVLGGMAHGPGFNFWTGILDGGHLSPANMNPGHTNPPQAEAMHRGNSWAVVLQANGMPRLYDAASTDADGPALSADLDDVASWSHSQNHGIHHSGTDIFLI